MTRIQERSRPTKRPMMRATYDISTGDVTAVELPGRKPKPDPRGFPKYGGIPHPVLAQVIEFDPLPGGGIDENYDPGDHTVTEVQAYITGLGDPNDQAVIDETQRVTDLERAGLNRTSLVNWLAARPGVV